MKKSLTNILYIKKRSYALLMEDDKLLKKQLDNFHRIIIDLKSINIKIDDEDQAIILLSFLPKRFEHFANIMLYKKATLSMGEVKAALNSKKIKGKMNLAVKGSFLLSCADVSFLSPFFFHGHYCADVVTSFTCLL